MSLAESQRLLWRSVRHDPAPPEVDDAFVSDARGSARERLDVYRRMYWYRQIDALFETFPVLARGLGAERFTKLGCAYLSAHPSEHPALERVGSAMASYLRARRDEPQLAGFWADVAKVEWAHMLSLLALDPPRVARFADLPSAPFAELRLELAPSVVTCCARADAITCVREAMADTEAVVRHVPADHSAVQTLLVWRPAFHTRQRALDPDEALALARAAKGDSLESVCFAYCDSEQAEQRAGLALHRWLADSLISAVFPLGGSR